MTHSIFIGRKTELQLLNDLYQKNTPALAVIKGRRRIGKSRLITEFAKTKGKKTFWSFSGLAPQQGITSQDQRNHFARQLSSHLKIPPMTFLDWSDAFNHLSLHLLPGEIVLFDEISWMGIHDPTFIPKLKAWWDAQSQHMLLVFCGSVSTWIEDNILKSTAFFGRIHLTISLEPLTIKESSEFLKKIGMQLSPYDTYKLLSIVGGIPWYLEQFVPTISADQNIKRLALEKNGLLVGEYDRIFHDLFQGKGSSYKQILDSLGDGAKTLAEIRETIGFSHSGTLTQMMEHLITAGFVTKQPLWSFKTLKALKQSLYRISDPYIRFYLKMIEPNISKINLGAYHDVPLHSLPGFDSHLGLQLEYLLLRNRTLILNSIGIHPSEVVADGPYRQSKTSTQSGCQIDYLLQTSTNTLFIFEFKFKRREIGSDIIQEIQEKIDALKVPKGIAVVPVLLHLSGVSDSVETSKFFYRIVDICDFLLPV